MQKTLVVFLAFFLSACGAASQPAVPAPEYIGFQQNATPTLPPAITPTASPTATPVPTTDPNFFRDDFNDTLGVGWSWVREDSANWSLIDELGSLKINVSGGYVAAHSNSNLLLRPAPSGNFTVETRIRFWPADNFQFAGLIIYQSDSNFIQAGREFCNTVGCIGEGLYMDTYRKGVLVQPNIQKAYSNKNNPPIFIRLIRRENTYTFETSTDGKVWFFIGSQTSDMDPLQIGVVTAQKAQGEVRAARFDYFEVRSLP